MTICYRALIVMVGVIACVAPSAEAQTSRWGVLSEVAKREWTTTQAHPPRVTIFGWEDEGKVLLARHGFVSRRAFGDDRFADTFQRFTLDPKTGSIQATYTYEDGRSPLQSTIRIEPDGSAIETFTVASGARRRNVHTTPTLSRNVIQRQELRAGRWEPLGVTEKAGLTRAEIAEHKRQTEQAQLRYHAESERQRAALYAIRDASYAAADAEAEAQRQQIAQNPNVLDVLNGLGASIQRDNQQRQAQLDRQLTQAIQEQARQKAEAARVEAQQKLAQNAPRQGVRARVEGQLGQTPVGGFPAPIVVPGGGQPVQGAAGGGAQAGQAALNCYDPRNARSPVCAQTKAPIGQVAQNGGPKGGVSPGSGGGGAPGEPGLGGLPGTPGGGGTPIAPAPVRPPVSGGGADGRTWYEAVTLCEKSGAQAQFGNWRCTGALQMNYINFDKPSWRSDLALTCNGPTMREIGVYGVYRVFGCGYPLHPSSTEDVAKRFGVFVERMTWKCPTGRPSCVQYY